MQNNTEIWNKRILNFIGNLIPYFPYVFLIAMILGILATLLLQQYDLTLRGFFIGFPAVLGAFFLLPILNKKQISNNIFVLFSIHQKHLIIIFSTIFFLTVSLLSLGFGRSWIYLFGISLLYVIILIQIFSNIPSKTFILFEIMVIQAELILSSIIKYAYYFGGTDIFPQRFLGIITYLSGHIIPQNLGNYRFFPLYHIWLAESSHILGIDIGTSIFLVTWPISVIGVVFIFYFFRKILKNDQIVLLICLIYSLLAIDLPHSTYMIPRGMAFAGFLMLLYVVFSSKSDGISNEKLYSYRILAILIMLLILLSHQVSVLIIISLLIILLICEWLVNNGKYLMNSFFVLLILISTAYWWYIAYPFTKSLIETRLNTENINSLVFMNAKDPITVFMFLINSISKEILLFFAVIAIGYILWQKKTHYLTVLTLFSSVCLILYVPNPLLMVWQIVELFGFERFVLFIGPFMAFIMGIGIFILFQNFLREKIPKKIIGILLIIIIFVFAASATNLISVENKSNREYFNTDDLTGLDFVNKYVPSGSTIQTDYFYQRFFDTSNVEGLNKLDFKYFNSKIILNIENIPNYKDYIVFPHTEFKNNGVSFGVIRDDYSQSIFVYYPTDDNIISLNEKLAQKNKLYSNKAVDVYLSK